MALLWSFGEKLIFSKRRSYWQFLMKQFLFFTFVLFAFAVTTAFSQTVIVPAFPDGEKLTYNLSFATFTDAGSIELTAVGNQKLIDRDVNLIRARLRTTGIVQSTLLDLNSEWTSFLDRETNFPVRVEHFSVNAGKPLQTTRDFSDNQVASQSTPPIINPNVYELLSAIYQTRRLDLTAATTQTLKVWDNEKVYETKLQVTGREIVSTPIGAINTFVVQIATDDKLFNRYKAKIYISDDERRLPVLATFKLPQGTVRAELVSAEILQPEPVVAVVPQPPLQQLPPVAVPPLAPRPAPTPKAYLENQPLDADLPFALGEKLEFEVLRGGQIIGNVRFEVRERKQNAGRDSVLLAASAQSRNNSNVFNQTDKAESLIDPNYLVPFRQEIKLTGGLAGFNQLLTFDQERGAVTTDKGVRAEVPVGTHDALSFLYALRAFRFSNAPQNALDTRAAVFLGGAPIIITLKPTRETIEFGGKKIAVITLTAVANNPQIDSLNLKLWLTDDARRLPLKFTCNTPLGAVQANLINF